MTQASNYYTRLGVARNAEPDEIRRAFRKLALQHHPDVSREPDAEERFKSINEAYQTLSNPEKRTLYDLRHGERVNKRRPEADDEEDQQVLNSTTCPKCGRRKNRGFRTCYACRPDEEICPDCEGYKKPQYSRCYTCRFG